jgi:hypothetical protein
MQTGCEADEFVSAGRLHLRFPKAACLGQISAASSLPLQFRLSVPQALPADVDPPKTLRRLGFGSERCQKLCELMVNHKGLVTLCQRSLVVIPKPNAIRRS